MVFTIGHSTRSLDELVDILRASEVSALIDIRSVPGSRRNPQYHKSSLESSIPEADMRYEHIPELGGYRKAKADERDAGWRNASFQRYSAHMRSSEFKEGLDHLEDLARRERICMMCSEAVWWRCHRRMVADALVAHDTEVYHLGLGHPSLHELTSFASVDNRSVRYNNLIANALASC